MITFWAYASWSATSSTAMGRTAPPAPTPRSTPTAPVPKPPATMFTTDRFIASAISLVRMPPDAPTSAPAMVSVAFCSTKPAIATAVPVNALSSEITTGMSAPPIGSTMSTPKPSAASDHDQQDRQALGAGDDRDARTDGHEEQPAEPAGRLAARSNRSSSPATWPRRASEPEKVMPPISTSRTVAVAVPADTLRVVVVVGDGDQRGRSATDRVEQADELRHRRSSAPRGPSRARPRRRPGCRRAARATGPPTSFRRARPRRTPRRARRAMPNAETWLPRRAVAGEFIRCRPRTKHDGRRPGRPAGPLCPRRQSRLDRSSIGVGTGRRRNMPSMRSVTR